MAKVGRPPKYATTEALEAQIDDYFELIKAEKDAKPTIYGLILHCGFCDRASFYDLEKQDKFSHTIKKARSRIAQIYEQRLHDGACSGAIFALKNFGWSDKQELDFTGDVNLKVNVKFVGENGKGSEKNSGN